MGTLRRLAATTFAALAVTIALTPALAWGAEADGPDDPLAPAPPTEPVTHHLVTTVSPDERLVTITGTGGALDGASTVAFRVWSDEGGADDLVDHGAVRQPDGSWLAKVYIAAPTPAAHDVPYNCRIPNAVHRLYNPYEGLHLYTDNVDEATNLARAGWNYEGVSWIAPDQTTPGVRPIYRLYNPYSGDHHFTMESAEYDGLVMAGWNGEGVQMYGRAPEAAAYPVYRLYHPERAVDTHLLTTDVNEYWSLPTSGWIQEGVSWCGETQSTDGAWSASGQATPHNDAGAYHVLAMVDNAAVSDIPVAAFTISTPTATVAAANVNNARGTFDVVVGGISSPSGVAAVEVPTWTTDGGQDDLMWHPATRNADGTYTATVAAADHNLGLDYIAHAFLTAGNGVRRHVGTVTTHLTLENYAQVSGGPNEYRLSLYNPGPISTVKMPTWSEEGGQDDIVWYEAATQGNGWWTATVSTRNFRHAGRCLTHIYVDDQLRNTLTFTIEPWELSLSGDAELDGIINSLLDNVIGREGDALRRAFDYVAKNYRYIHNDESPEGDFTGRFAKEMYYNQGGNCYRFAALFHWLARGLGYESRVAVGALPTYTTGYAPHGWVEVNLDGQWYICDPEEYYEFPTRNWYLRTYDSAPTYYELYFYAPR